MFPVSARCKSTFVRRMLRLARPRPLPLLIVLSAGIGLTAAVAAAHAADLPPTTRISELTPMGWQDVNAPATQPEVNDPALDRVESLLERHQYDAAKEIVVPWLKSHKVSPVRDRALYLMAEALYQYGDRIQAFYYLDELMDEYPQSKLFYMALDKQYQIADAYLSGYKRRFLLLPILPVEDEAVEMLYRIQQRSPGSPLAEKALLRTAEYYFANRDYDLAADTYAAYIRSYPRSPQVPFARLRQAYSNCAQFRGLRFDPTPLIDARAQLMDILTAYPDLARQNNVQALIDRIDRTFAQKIFATADYYQRTHQLKAAAWNYLYLVKTYPNALEAPKAQTRLAKLPDWTKQPPLPEAGEGYSPATQPAAPGWQPILP